MSNGQIRADIASALNGVDGVLVGHASRPTTLNEGDAWPQWAGSVRAGGHSMESTWNVLVVLPQSDDVSADSYADAHGAAIIDALRPHLLVDEMKPAMINGESGDLYALLLIGRAE